MIEGAVISISQDGERVVFLCPGCGEHHGVWIKQPPEGGNRGLWTWNGDRTKPTFTPSILVTTHQWDPPVTPENIEEWRNKPWKQTKVDRICHSHITDGVIQFLGDCTHSMAGQTVPLKPDPLERPDL